jgi:hypothetical protein
VQAASGDEVFLIDWRAEDGAHLAGWIIVSQVRPRKADWEIIPHEFRLLPGNSLPQHLAIKLPRQYNGSDPRRLLEVDSDIGMVLRRIVEKFVLSAKGSGTTGTRHARGTRPKSDEQQIKAIERKAEGRLGQAAFRDALMDAYGGRCAISGCSIDECLSAAHILDYSKSECQEVWNGILLRADIHLLFDRHVLRIFPGNPPVVVLNDELQESKSYKRFHHRPLRLPKNCDEKQTNGELRRRWIAANEVMPRFEDPPKTRRGD